MTDDPGKLVGGYATDTLDAEERRKLYEAALEDQKIFNALLEDQALRDLLSQPGVRRSLLRGLKGESTSKRLGKWLRNQTVWAAGGALAAASVILLVVYAGGLFDPEGLAVPLATGTVAKLSIASLQLPASASREKALSRDVLQFKDHLMGLPVRETLTARLALSRRGRRPRFRVGEQLRIGFLVETNAKVVILEQGESGSIVQVFPNRFAPSPRVQGEETVFIPPNRQGNLRLTEPGQRRLRMIVFPIDVDPFELDVAALNTVESQLTIIEKAYDVASQ